MLDAGLFSLLECLFWRMVSIPSNDVETSSKELDERGY